MNSSEDSDSYAVESTSHSSITDGTTDNKVYSPNTTSANLQIHIDDEETLNLSNKNNSTKNTHEHWKQDMKLKQIHTHYRIQKRRYEILDKIRINCVNLSAYHNHRYHLYKNLLFTVFRVPLIILSGVNSFFSVGLQHYMAQHYISLINAMISLFCGILTSIELLLNLQKRMELELECGKEYYKLGVEIFTELCREPEDRGESGNLGKFLTEKHNTYQTLYAKSNAVNISEKDFVDEFELFIIQSDDISTFYPDIEFMSEQEKDNIYRHLNRGDAQKKGSISQNNNGSCHKCWTDTFISCLTTLVYCCTFKEKHSFEPPNIGSSPNIQKYSSPRRLHSRISKDYAIRKKRNISNMVFGDD